MADRNVDTFDFQADTEIFLIKLIAMSSDSLDKIRDQSVMDKSVLDSQPEMFIHVQPDRRNNSLTIIDSGVGMTKADICRHVDMATKAVEGADVRSIDCSDSIYSACLAADELVVTSKSNNDEQYMWRSAMGGSSAVHLDKSPLFINSQLLGRGTKIQLFLKADKHEFLNERRLKELIKKRSEFTEYPILLWIEKTAEEEEADLRGMKEEVHELTIRSSFLTAVPEWLEEFVNLQELNLEGFSSGVYSHDNRERALLETLGDLWALKKLRLDHFNELESLPGSIQMLTSLETLHISTCAITELPVSFSKLTGLNTLDISSCDNLAFPSSSSLWQLTGLQTLTLHDLAQLKELSASLCNFMRLETLDISSCTIKNLPPSFGRMTALKNLALQCVKLKALPDSIGTLTGLESMSIYNCAIQSLPSTFGQLTALQTLSLWGLKQLKSLPACVGFLTSMHSLHLKRCGIQELPANIGALTKLKTLHLIWCDKLKDLPRSIESLTSLHTMSLRFSQSVAHDRNAFKTLAFSLPALRLLLLNLEGQNEDDVLAIGRSFKAWPDPISLPVHINLKSCWQALSLPPEGGTWNDATVLEYLILQQQNMVAFASGLHVRLGAASRVSWLNDFVLVLIADEVLGCWSLLQKWQRGRLPSETGAIY